MNLNLPTVIILFGSKTIFLFESEKYSTVLPIARPKIAYLFAGSARSFVCSKVHSNSIGSKLAKARSE